jgi:hypothetical protein
VGQAFSLCLVTTEPNWVVMGDVERTKDRQTDRMLGPGVLDAQVEMHSSFTVFLISIILFIYFYSASCYLSSFFLTFSFLI